MNIMNKLYKCTLWLLTAFILSFTCFSNAENVEDIITYIKEENVSVWAYSTKTIYELTNSSDYWTYCLYIDNLSDSINIWFNSSLQYVDNLWYRIYSDNPSVSPYFCIFSNLRYIFFYNTSSSQIDVNYKFFKLNALINTQLPVLTSLECQTEYNLIPISEVTANYCALNFWMIDPQECPINQWTWAIVRSNLMINDIPYAQNQNINVFIPDFLAWNIAFNDFNTVIEVEWYNADEEYIQNVINQEKLTPTNKDIEEMITWFMTNYFPYLALAIVFLYLARKIYKIFK